MSRMSKLARLSAPLALLALAFSAAPALALPTNTITSGSFSIGLGDTGSWNQAETFGVNTQITPVGDFTLTPTLTGGAMTSAGPSFEARVLTDRQFQNGYYVGEIIPFLASIAGAYTGPTPGDAALIPNYQLQVNVTSMTIWVFNGYGAAGTESVQFNETTAGNTQNSGAQALTFTTAGGTWAPANFEQHGWNPTEFTSAGLTQTRTFTMNQFSSGAPGFNDGAIDGFEIYGNVQLTYDVPEPASLSLLALGGVLALPRRRRV